MTDSNDTKDIRYDVLYEAGRLIPDSSVYAMSQSFEQDCRRYSHALTEESEVSIR